MFQRSPLLLALALTLWSCASSDQLEPATAEVGAGRRETTGGQYNRKDWHHWVDADNDCQDTREEVLIAESEIPLEFKDRNHCHVARGRWTCPYTGETVTDPALPDIDHLVPLENANRSGGWRWSAGKKEAYANDLDEPEHLVAVLASANRSKGSKGPEAWQPKNGDFRCDYVSQWRAIKRRWRLRMNSEERRTVEQVLLECGK